MTRQHLSQLRISSLRLQQGLFASLALMVTLIVGQQMQAWQQSHQQQVPQFERPIMTQTHFSSLESRSLGNLTAPQLRVVDQDSTLGELPVQERWVF
ncbi:hypothetical protein JBE38_10190 [Pseudomonas sp. ICBG1301]|uniref:hypothetical protein n=1 Tax=Pseudomonas sp. ICBG1301 TaxID=2795987 RepID=UPI001966A15D|nr:hypothetical protein [Pseudomonas sp. ICBG1301]MBM9486284.1 hypothetical protein [Pseudomonas sp. ICBG1301]